jgi:hypothetical protein
MSHDVWKIHLVRNISGIESSLHYDLPKEYGDMLEGVASGAIEDEYVNSIYSGIYKHIEKKFYSGGWESAKLIAPEP